MHDLTHQMKSYIVAILSISIYVTPKHSTKNIKMYLFI